MEPKQQKKNKKLVLPSSPVTELPIEYVFNLQNSQKNTKKIAKYRPYVIKWKSTLNKIKQEAIREESSSSSNDNILEWNSLYTEASSKANSKATSSSKTESYDITFTDEDSDQEHIMAPRPRAKKKVSVGANKEKQETKQVKVGAKSNNNLKTRTKKTVVAAAPQVCYTHLRDFWTNAANVKSLMQGIKNPSVAVAAAAPTSELKTLFHTANKLASDVINSPVGNIMRNTFYLEQSMMYEIMFAIIFSPTGGEHAYSIMTNMFNNEEAAAVLHSEQSEQELTQAIILEELIFNVIPGTLYHDLAHISSL